MTLFSRLIFGLYIIFRMVLMKTLSGAVARYSPSGWEVQVLGSKPKSRCCYVLSLFLFLKQVIFSYHAVSCTEKYYVCTILF